MVEGVEPTGDRPYTVPTERSLHQWVIDNNNAVTNYEKKKQENDRKEEAVDFETAMDKAGFGKFNYLLLLMMLPSTWSSGWDTSSLSMVLPIAGCDLNLSSIQKGVLNSAIYLGMVSSAFLWGFLSDTYGRQKMLAGGYLLDALCSALCSLSSSFWPLFIFKFMSGFMICGPYSILMAYLSEVFSKKYRDMVLLSAGIFFALGSVVHPGLGLALIPLPLAWEFPWLPTIYSWRLYLLMSCLPALLAGLATLFCVESPKFLLDKGRHDEALAVLTTIYRLNSGKPASSYPVKRLVMPAVELDGEDGDQHTGKMSFLVRRAGRQVMTLIRPPYLIKSAFCCIILTLSVTALNGLRLILPEIFSHYGDVGADEEGLCTVLHALNQTETVDCDDIEINPATYINMMCIYGFCFLCQVVFNILARFVPKSWVIIMSAAVPAVCGVLIPLMPLSYVLPLASVYVSLLNINFYAAISVVVLMFPTSLRATSVSMAMMVARSAMLGGNLFVSGLIYSSCQNVFFVFAAFLAVVSIFSFFIPSEDQSGESKAEDKQEV